MKGIKTRGVEKYLYVNYLRRSGELLRSAKRCRIDSIFAAASINAVFSAVAAIDAVCVYYLQKGTLEQTMRSPWGFLWL